MKNFVNIFEELGTDTADVVTGAAAGAAAGLDINKINTDKDIFASPVVNYDEYLTALKNKDDIDASIPHPYGHGILKVYHGTNVNNIGLNDLDESKTTRQLFGPGVYFTPDYITAASYGSNIIETSLDVDRLVNGDTDDPANIEHYRDLGYIGAIFSMPFCVLGCVIWHMSDIK